MTLSVPKMNPCVGTLMADAVPRRRAVPAVARKVAAA